MFLNIFLASFLTTNTLCEYSPQTYSLPSFLPLSLMAQSASIMWMMGQAVTGESLNLPEQAGWEADSWLAGGRGVDFTEAERAVEILPQTPLLGPIQPSFSKWVYSKSVSTLELYILGSLLCHVFRPWEWTSAFMMAMAHDPHLSAGLQAVNLGLSAIWKEARNLSNIIRDKVRITSSSKACTGSLKMGLFQISFFLENEFLFSFIRST